MTRSGLIRELDSTISTYVIARDAGCVTCGAVTGLTSSHFIRRGKLSVRFVEANVFCQCADCNRDHDRNQGPLTVIFFSRFNFTQYEQLAQRSKELSHFKEYQLQELLHQWEAKTQEALKAAALTEAQVNLLKFKQELKVSEV